MDQVVETLIEAFKLALAQPGEQRLFKSGKLEGLFTNRTGVNAEAAERAVREGLLEVVRTETKGKTVTEWVRLTPRALEFLHDHESPVQALRDLQAVLQVNRAQIPLWLTEMQRELQTLTQRLTDEAERWTQRLESLCQQVDAALKRCESAPVPMPPGAEVEAPWAAEALVYLDHRRVAGATGDCPMPELFAALRERHPDLSVTGFHDRLRRLRDRGALRLLPFPGPADQIPEPEYALLEGVTLLYLVGRQI
jgi:hypothetical protein